MSEKPEYSPKMQTLLERVAEFTDLQHIMAVLGWDQQIYMPPGGAEERGLQSAALGRILHEKFATEEFGQLIADLEAEVGDLNAETDAARSVKTVKRAYEKQVKVPLPMLMETIKAQTMGHEAWVKARAQSDFSIFQPHLETLVDLRKQYADLFKPYDHIYDPLLDDFEPGMKTTEVKEIFDALRPQQVELLQEIAEKEPPDNSFIKQHYNEEHQELFGRHVITCFGYDWQRGRLDVAPHPFTTEFGYGDVRITTATSNRMVAQLYLARCTNPDMPCTVRACLKSINAIPLAGQAHWRFMNRNRACGKISSDAVRRSGRTFILLSRCSFRSTWEGSAWKTFTAGLTGSNLHLSGLKPMKPPTTCTSCCAWKLKLV